MAKLSNADIIASLKEMTMLELNDLVKAIEEEFGVTAAAPVAVVAGGAEEAAGPSEVTVTLTAPGASKVGVIKVVREITGLGLVEAKGLVDKAPSAVKENWFEFDVIVATPDMMAELGKLGRVLGPKGLMPNPKTGTVTMDIKKAVEEIKAGKVEYRVDKEGNIHVGIAKISFENEKIVENFKAIFEAILKAKPAAAKGTYMKNVTLTSTMGPGIKINTETVL